MSYECENCGAAYQFGPAGESLVSISIFHNGASGEDYTAQICPDCYHDLLEEFRDAVNAPDRDEDNEDTEGDS